MSGGRLANVVRLEITTPETWLLRFVQWQADHLTDRERQQLTRQFEARLGDHATMALSLYDVAFFEAVKGPGGGYLLPPLREGDRP